MCIRDSSVTDEVFGVSVSRPGRITPWYSYGVMALAAPGWTLGTFLGVVSGNILPDRIVSAPVSYTHLDVYKRQDFIDSKAFCYCFTDIFSVTGKHNCLFDTALFELRDRTFGFRFDRIRNYNGPEEFFFSRQIYDRTRDCA